MTDIRQLTLFPEEATRPKPRRPKPTGGSNNPIVFHDYESYIAKFQGKEKTTDDTYTPQDVFEAVVKYVGEVYPLEGKEILRPFYPGGDYERAEYPEDGVVIDNPPFSIFTKICAFYSARQIPFFLFGPGLTIASCCDFCTAVIIGTQTTFLNGAKVKCNFASNLFGDAIMMTAPRLDELITACPSQDAKARRTAYVYPDEILSVSDMQAICNGGVDFSVSRKEAQVVRNMDNHPKKAGLFGNHLLLARAKARAIHAIHAIHIPLSPRERRIVEALGKNIIHGETPIIHTEEKAIHVSPWSPSDGKTSKDSVAATR